MTTLLMLAFAAGVLTGGIAGVVVGRRWGAARAAWRRLSSDSGGAVLPVPEPTFPSDANFEALASSLVDRCAGRVQLPCALAMRDKEGAPARFVALSEGVDPRLFEMELPLESPAGRAILEGVPVVGAADEPVIQAVRRDRRRPIQGGIAVPVAQGGRAAGAVIAFGSPPTGPGDAVHGLSALVRMFAGQLLQAHAVWVAHRRAETDDLTGLPNRRHLMNMMARGAGKQAALVLLDIDHFKKINDTYGHVAGDAALKHVARVLTGTLRGGDPATRLGGEEFAVWLAGAPQHTALEIAERLRAQVEREPFRWQGEAVPLTMSCGVACYPNPIGHPDNLMAAADSALYQAKSAGRNCVVAAKQEPRPVAPA